MVAYFPSDTYKLVSLREYPGHLKTDGALVDTNILVDFLSGKSEAVAVLDEYEHLYTSTICYMEVMANCETPDEEVPAQAMFAMFRILPVLHPVEEIGIALRRHSLRLRRGTGTSNVKIRLPDILIHATAIANKLVMVTNNTKDFKKVPMSVLKPFGCGAVLLHHPY